jgi:hypothetical protein
VALQSEPKIKSQPIIKMKHRQYSVVVHNVSPEKTQDIVKQYVAKKAKEYVMSVEPYPQGNGSHLHLFLQYNNQRSFKAVLAELEIFKQRFIEPRPDGEERSWGRVQLDPMRGRFSQAEAYLQGETKDKPIGDVLKGVVKPCFRRHRFTQKIGDYKNMEEFCSRCNSSLCWGCCPGCVYCDESIVEEFEGQRKMYLAGVEYQRRKIKEKQNPRRHKSFYGYD